MSSEVRGTICRAIERTIEYAVKGKIHISISEMVNEGVESPVFFALESEINGSVADVVGSMVLKEFEAL